jgi:tetratricopeptide (TPR) repeat protein
MAEVEFRELEIHIRKPAADGACPITVSGPDDRRADGELRVPYAEAEVDRALAWMEQGLFDAAYVQEFGTGLFGSLFVGPLKAVYDGSWQSGGPPLRYRLIIDAPAVARIPWELLYDPERAVFLALEGTLVRSASFTVATRPLRVQPPLRVLVVDAFPQGVLKVDNQVETNGIQQALAGLVRRGRVEVETLPHATLARLQDALREAANPEQPRPFHLLHFIGHGRHDAADGRTVLLFEDEEGQIDEVDAETLVNVLRPYDLKLVFLNACQSVQSSALDVAQGFAPALLASGIPAVIGMQVTVLDTVAVQVSREFYAALADNRSVDAALTDARRLVRGTQRRRKADLGIPVCYLRGESGRILEVQPLASVRLTRATWRPWLRQHATAGGVATAVVTLIGLVASVLQIAGVIPSLFNTVEPMNGDLNVAVAQFSSLDATGRTIDSAEARGLAESTYSFLGDELEPLKSGMAAAGGRFDIQVRSPARIGPIAGATREARAQHAESVARSHNADLVIYGTLHLGSGITRFVPEFYLSERKLRDAEELVGQGELGSQFEAAANLSENLIVRQQLRERLLSRTRALAYFVFGLGYYALDMFDQADSYLRAAAEATDDRLSQALFHQFLGNTAGKRRDLQAAEDHYARALELEPEYARARLGAAEVLFQRARATCERGVSDIEGLQSAVRAYQHALEAEFRPARSQIEVRIAFGLGRAYWCLSRADDRSYAESAERELRKVTAVDGEDNVRLNDLAAEAHFILGLVYLPYPDDPPTDAQAKYRRAAGEYRLAIERIHQRERQALFYAALGDVHGRLQEYDDADAAFARAIELNPERRALYEEQRERWRTQRATARG